MDSLHFFTYLYQTFDQNFLGWVQQVVTSLATAMRAPVIAAVTLYIAGLAAIELYDPSGNPMSFLIKKVIRGAVVILAVTAANYSDLFGNFVLNTLPNDITAAIAGSLPGVTKTPAMAPAAFDTLFGQMWAAANEAYKNISGYSAKSLGLGIAIMAYAAFSALAIGGGFLIFMAQHIMLGLCIAIGPLLIFALLWPRTTRIFDGWIAVLLALIMTQVMLVALLSFLVIVDGAILVQIATMNGGPGVNASDELGQLHLLMEGLVLAASISYFANRLPHIAHSITGGVAAEISPITRMISQAVSSTVGSVGKTISAGSAPSGGAAGMRSLKPAGKAP